MKQKTKFPSTVKDYLVTGEMFELIYHSEKEMLITQPKPSPENLSKYYESDAYISHTDNAKGLVSFLYQTVKKRALCKKIKLISNLNNGKGRLLDIGAGTGDFLMQAKEKGWEIFGIEPNQKAIALAQKKGIELKEKLEDFAHQKMDVITLWHVLEHLPNLEQDILKIESLLKPNGILIVAVPNYKSFDAKYYKQFWAAYDVPRHLWHFSRESMKRIFPLSLQIQKIKPMIFDSFYVSLLSEKHKTNSTNFVSAFCIGLLSNIKAWKSKEYSSLIYCFKKSK